MSDTVVRSESNGSIEFRKFFFFPLCDGEKSVGGTLFLPILLQWEKREGVHFQFLPYFKINVES